MGTKLRMAEQATNEGLQTFCRWCQRRIRVVTEWRRTVESAGMSTTLFETISGHFSQIDTNRRMDFVAHAGIKKLKLMVA